MSITDLFFRPFDKARLERLVMAIDQDKLSAALVCDSEGLLDHYGRMLVKKLRLNPNLTVEVYYPNSTEALLNRFNRILEDVPIDSAVKTEFSEAPDKVLVAFDSQATGIREVQLMARLVKDFPGANTRVILMLDKLSSTQYEKKIQAFGNKIIRWDIATPTDREAAVLLSESELSGMRPEVRQALANVGVSLDAKLALAASSQALSRAEATLSPKFKDNADKKEPGQIDIDSAVLKDIEPPISNKKQTETSSKKKVIDEKTIKLKQKKLSEKINALVATLFLVFVSGGVLAWVTVTEALSVDKILNEVRSVFLATPEVTKLKNIQKNQEFNQDLTKISEVDRTFSDKEFVELESSNNGSLDTIENSNEQAQNQLEEDLTAKNSNKLSNSVKLITKQQIKTKKENPLFQPGFYVQHTARPNKELAEDLKNKFPSLSNASILKLSKTKSEGHFFVLLSGPFTSLDEAKAFTMRNDIPEGTWIRGALGIRPLIMPIN